MLFNSIPFITIFLPICLIAFYLAVRTNTRIALYTLIVFSLVFYAYWNPPFVLLIIASICINFQIGSTLQKLQSGGAKKLLLATGIILNISCIGYFKYANFFIDIANSATGGSTSYLDLVLPLGISFFTFQQIAYLVDVYQHKVSKSSFTNYAFFISFFPQLIAGPIVHHSKIIPQLSTERFSRFNNTAFFDGLTIFLLGLAKKVLLADQFAMYADVGFAAAAAGEDLSLLEAWGCALAYTFQLYFDFSGYSDMAIGLARMFNIELPMNFNSPYKARNIIDFWRRWHITLSEFLRDYLYIPLGGSRLGPLRRHVNLMLTMLIGGLWHGAGWSFVLWGGWHGLALVVNHMWLKVRGDRASGRIRNFFCWTLTFLVVVIGWVLFRAENVNDAVSIYRGMIGLNGATAPDQIIALLGPLRAVFEGVGNLPYLYDASVLGFLEVFAMLGFGLLLCAAFPNLHQLTPAWRVWILVPSFALTIQKIFFSDAASPFLYFQF